MSSTEGELMEVSMVTEVVGEPQKEDSARTPSDTMSSSVEVAMAAVSGESTVEIQHKK